MNRYAEQKEKLRNFAILKQWEEDMDYCKSSTKTGFYEQKGERT